MKQETSAGANSGIGRTCLILLLVVTGCAQKVDTVEEFLELAYHHERKSEYPEAVTAYKQALALDSRSSTAWYDLGVAYAAMQQWPEAVDAYSNAIELDPGMARAYNNRAAAYARLKQFERAISDCDIAVKLDSNDALAWRNRGLAYHDDGQLENAIADYDESIRINGRNAETYLYRGNVFLDRKQWNRAIDDFDQAIRLDQNIASAWLSRAIALARLGRREEAETARSQAEQLGTDVSNVVLDDIDPGVAPVASTLDLRQQAVSFVEESLRSTNPELKSTDLPWDLQSNAEGTQRYVVRLLSGTQNQRDVTFTTEEIEKLRNASEVQTTLVVVHQSTDIQDNVPKLSFRIIQSLDNWSPDFEYMKPVAWSLPVSVPEHIQSSADASGSASNSSASVGSVNAQVTATP